MGDHCASSADAGELNHFGTLEGRRVKSASQGLVTLQPRLSTSACQQCPLRRAHTSTHYLQAEIERAGP